MFSQKSEIERLRKRVEVLEAKVDNLMRNAGYDVDKPAVEASSEVKELLLPVTGSLPSRFIAGRPVPA